MLLLPGILYIFRIVYTLSINNTYSIVFFLNLFIIENFKYMQKNSTVKHHMPSNKTVIHSWPPVSPRIFSHLCQYSIIIPVSLWLLPIMVSPDIHKAHFLSPFMFSLTSP
jgi:hypothetical protein